VAHKINLRNSSEKVILDDKGYKFLTTDKYLSGIDIITRLRKHSSGCAVFQRTQKQKKGGYKTETIYLHKLIAEKFIKKGRSKTKKLVGALNGNKLDCRIDNLAFRSRSTASRQRKSSSKAGFTGVYKESTRFRAVISNKGKSIHIGMFDTAVEAADAYNKKSREFYGDEGKINVIPRADLSAAKKATREKVAAKKAEAKAKAAAKKVAPKKASAKKVAPKKAAAKKVAPKKASAKKVVPKKASAKKVAPKKAVAKKVVPKKAAAKKVAPKKASAKKVAPKKAAAKKVAPKKAAAKKVAPKKASAKKAAPKKAVAKKVAPKKVAAKKVAPKKAVAKKVAPKKVAPKKAVVKKVAPKKKK
jgi:hypothetical protein